jgi:hypothetical protein
MSRQFSSAPAQVLEQVVEAIDDESFRDEFLRRDGVLFRLQACELRPHVVGLADQVIDLAALQLGGHFVQEVDDHLVEDFQGVVPRPAAAVQVRVERAARGNHSEDMGQQAVHMVALQAKDA